MTPDSKMPWLTKEQRDTLRAVHAKLLFEIHARSTLIQRYGPHSREAVEHYWRLDNMWRLYDAIVRELEAQMPLRHRVTRAVSGIFEKLLALR